MTKSFWKTAIEIEREIIRRMDTREKLVMWATKRQWYYVCELLAEHPNFHDEKLTRSGDTALHLALSDGQTNVVRRLIHLLQKEKKTEVLKAKNEAGNTPLHLAAALRMESVEMCKSIASMDHDHTLIRARNHDKETPFFVAVLNGNKDAFRYLHDLILKDIAEAEEATEPLDSYCRSSNGNTILHAAITREYFG
ncbi:unnamed protein product [Camellia sinensis]